MNLKESLEKKRFVVTSEVQVPLGDEESEGLVESLGRVKGRVDGLSIAEIELEGVVSDTIKTCGLLKENNLNAIYQTTTRDKNRFQLQKDLTLAHETGVDNLLVFTEDYRISGDTLQESMFFHVDSGKLGSVLNHLKQGVTIEGKELESKVEFSLGSGIETPWGKSMPKRGMEEMEDMMNVGAGYFLTTPIFDIDQFAKFMKQVEPFRVPVIAEVMILRTAGMGKFLNRHFKSGLVPEWVIQKLMNATNKKKASMELFADTVKSLKDICQGVHIVTIGGVDNLVQYLNAAKLR
ncbi:methylenetetrahydrofolate reductase [Desulfobacula phenolica]|uniref:Methylenetetrahydrofolate reductase n=1 Tax=Desulfobacula phenolica TaxID=90732 RepID=A0A1H2FJZ5_9BACT|nr:methylenetetrahydrofolate reductase [Desulfobacula phenolica]SDU07677.1 5,10-methylenetetrahydrofolate reductase [Desulfobacula phenolica]